MAQEEREQLDELLSAYLDGELDAEETGRVERALREDPNARRLLEELRRTARLVATLPHHPAPASILEDVWSRVERGELLGDFEDRRAASPGWRSPMVALLSMAAMLALVVVSVWYLGDRPGIGPGSPGDVVVLAPVDLEAGERGRLLEKKAKVDERPVRSSRGDRARAGRETSGKDEKRRGPGTKKLQTSTRGRGGETVRSLEQPPKTPAVALSQLAEVNLLATANVDQKLVTSLRVSELRQHPFANETLRLQVVANDRAQRDAIAAGLVARLARSRIADLADQGGDVPARTLAPDGFYYQGRPGVNFETADESQILVRVSGRVFNALLDEVDRLPIAGDRVVLYSGPFGVRGLDHARRLLGDSVGASPRRGAGERDERVARRDDADLEAGIGTAGSTPGRGGDAKGAFTDLIQSVGIDLDTFTAKPDAVARGPSIEEEAVSGPSESARTRPASLGQVRSKTAATEAAPAKPIQPTTPQIAKAGKGKKEISPPWALYDADEVTHGGPPDQVAEGVAAAEPEQVQDGTATVSDTSTFVDRRLKELAEPRRTVDPDTGPRKSARRQPSPDDWSKALEEHRSPESALAMPSADQYLTVVVRLMVERPESADSSEKGHRPESETRAKSRPLPKSPPKSTPRK